MSGYTPLYDSMLTGTLHGRWPHTGIWACLLSRVSREGLLDETPQSLAAAIGVPVDLLMECITDFMQPDPDSRTQAKDGRRLELIDPSRKWGWRVVNHGKYREKARKKNFDEDRTSSGKDAERKAEERMSRGVPRCPAVSRDVPLSEAEAKAVRGTPKAASRRCPGEFNPDPKTGEAIPDLNFLAELSRFKDYEFKTARKDWDAAWRNWLRTCKDTGKYAKKESKKWY